MCHGRPSVHVAPYVGSRSGRTRAGASDLVIGEGQHSVLACIRSVPAEERRDQGEHPLRPRMSALPPHGRPVTGRPAGTRAESSTWTCWAPPRDRSRRSPGGCPTAPRLASGSYLRSGSAPRLTSAGTRSRRAGRRGGPCTEASRTGRARAHPPAPGRRPASRIRLIGRLASRRGEWPRRRYSTGSRVG
jgi:hypothetical protein